MIENQAKRPHRAIEEVPTMIDPEIIRQIRTLSALNWGAKRIARELGIARNTVRRYLRTDEVSAAATKRVILSVPGGFARPIGQRSPLAAVSP
jgi:response regulator of citrate/malate metabolism